MNKRKRIVDVEPKPTGPPVKLWTLPKDLWAYVASFFCQKSRAAFRRVNHFSHSVLELKLSMPRTMNIESNSLEQVLNILKRVEYQQPWHLAIHCPEKEEEERIIIPLMEHLAEKKKCLTSIIIDGPPIQYKHLQIICPILSRLIRLQFPDSIVCDKMLDMICQHGKHLEVLELGIIQQVNETFQALKSLKKLRILKLGSTMYQVESRDIASLSKTLEQFFLGDGHGLISRSDYQVFLQFPKLHTLCLGRERQNLEMESDSLMGLEGIPLTELSLESTKPFQEPFLCKILEKMPLQKLFLFNACLQGSFCKALSRNTRLTSVIFTQSNCNVEGHRLKTCHLQESLATCPHLTSIHLNNNVRLSYKLIESFSHLVHLKCLSLTNCTLTVLQARGLQKFKSLDTLDLSRTSLTDAHLQYLPTFIRLALYLDGENQEFTSQGLCRYISKLNKNLKQLTLPYHVEKKVLTSICKSKLQLETLRLGDYISLEKTTKCTKTELIHFGKKIPSLKSFVFNNEELISFLRLQ